MKTNTVSQTTLLSLWAALHHITLDKWKFYQQNDVCGFGCENDYLSRRNDDKEAKVKKIQTQISKNSNFH